MNSSSGLEKFQIFQNHKSVGITILLLSLIRLGWRLMHRPVAPPDGLAKWERVMAKITHWGFYIVMIGLPLTGWLAVSASSMNLPTLLYRVGGFPGIPWPHIPGVAHLLTDQKKAVEHGATFVHDSGVLAAYALIALHLAGVAKHQFVGSDPVLHRMAPFMRRGTKHR